MCRQIPKDFEIQDGVPDGGILYGVPKDEPCWTAWIPGPKNQLDGDEYICVRNKNGRLIHIDRLNHY